MLEVGFSAMLATMSCPEEMPPSVPPAWLLRNPCARDLVAVLGALLLDAGKAGADLDALHRVDAHEGVGDIRVQAIEDGLAQPRRNPGGHHVDARADGVALLAQSVHVGLQFRHRVPHRDRRRGC